jgi:hypothetical protein
VGEIWASDYDIDVAGELLDGTALAGECKWRRDATGVNALRELRARVTNNAFYADRRSRTAYVIFSRSAVTAELRRSKAEDTSVLTLNAAELIGARRRKR